MAKRGLCRCGTVLRFDWTSQGYKTRCPVCRSVVRLRGEPEAVPARKPPSSVETAPQPAIPAISHSSPPPLPTDFQAEEIPLLEDVPVLEEVSDPSDLKRLERHSSFAPKARVDLDAYDESELPPPQGLPLWGMGVLVILVLGAICAAAVFLS